MTLKIFQELCFFKKYDKNTQKKEAKNVINVEKKIIQN